nr:NAD-dependent DNA ligase LigA [Clostridiales bacterium]
LMSASKEEIEAIDGFGEIMIDSIQNYFSLPSVIEEIESLKSLGVNMSSAQPVSDNRFAGFTFVLTGTLPTYSRQQASEIIEKYGGKVSSSVSKKTSFVLAGEEAGSKLIKANELSIKIINEDEFNKMISD